MSERLFKCQQCRHVFKLLSSVEGGACPLPLAPAPETEDIKCPECGSSRLESLSNWAPQGFNIPEDRTLWEYECQECRHTFKLPIPSSPSQEKAITCPLCGCNHIHRLTRTGGEPLYCG